MKVKTNLITQKVDNVEMPIDQILVSIAVKYIRGKKEEELLAEINSAEHGVEYQLYKYMVEFYKQNLSTLVPQESYQDQLTVSLIKTELEKNNETVNNTLLFKCLLELFLKQFQ